MAVLVMFGISVVLGTILGCAWRAIENHCEKQ